MVAIYGKHHGEDDDIAKKAYSVIEYMRSYLDELAEIYKLNFTLLATPAESVAGRFALINRKKYGIIEGVTDNDFITNSFHVPVYHEISITKKIDIEAPYHALCNAGHISYIELDGDPTTNLAAFEKIIRYMHDKGMGYMSINHPVDRDPVCGYTGVIKDVCPRCGRTECDDIDMDKLFELAKIYPEASVSYNKFLKQLTNKQCKGE
jgi:ribonucleoside-triphosphate reductase